MENLLHRIIDLSQLLGLYNECCWANSCFFDEKLTKSWILWGFYQGRTWPWGWFGVRPLQTFLFFVLFLSATDRLASASGWQNKAGLWDKSVVVSSLSLKPRTFGEGHNVRPLRSVQCCTRAHWAQSRLCFQKFLKLENKQWKEEFVNSWTWFFGWSS